MAAPTKLALGLAAGATASLATRPLERLAFTDLLNFSSDYRTTGAFWECMSAAPPSTAGWSSPPPLPSGPCAAPVPTATGWRRRASGACRLWQPGPPSPGESISPYRSPSPVSPGDFPANGRPAPRPPPRWGLAHWALAVVV